MERWVVRMNNARNTLFGVVGTVAGIAITILLTQTILAGIISKMDWFAENGLYSYLALLGVIIIMAILLIPASLSKFACGHLFGFIPGMIFAWVASMIAALFPHALARKWLRPWARKIIEKHPLMEDVEQAIVNEGWKTVAYTRISLVLPYAVLNYAFGVTSVKTTDLIKGNTLMIVPSAIYTWWGSQARLISEEGFSAQGDGYLWVMGFSIIFTVWIIHHLRKITMTHISEKTVSE
jgi:uncharacterized membrane protein YdjX (TVP38/TMEM64 family)